MESNEYFSDQIQLEGLSESEIRDLNTIMNRFLDMYRKKTPKADDREWLMECYRKEFPDWEEKKLEKLTEDTISSIKEYEDNLSSIEFAAKSGISSECWFDDAIMKASKGIAINEFGSYLTEIDAALTAGNTQMMRTVMTQTGEISQCYNLDGFIAEQHHVNTFNAEAALRGSNYVAKVQVPEPGQTYGKNSFDCVIVDKTSGKIVQQYQAKYGATARDTIKLLKSGNYNNQRYLVPADQVVEVQAAFPGKTVTSTMGSDELGVLSKPLTKAQAKELQIKVQERGAIEAIDYNSFQTKALALHITKNAAMTGACSAAITTSFILANKMILGEHLDADETVEIALVTGTDAGIKAAASGALKVGAEKGIIGALPPGTPIHVISNIACVGIENVKILTKVATGELTPSQALDKMGRTSTAMVYGLGWGAASATFGAVAMSWIPIAGPVIGTVIGGMIGYTAGSKFGSTVYEGAKKIASIAQKCVKNTWEGVKSTAKKVASGFRRIRSRIASRFGF